MTSILEVEQLDTLSSNASSTITIGGTNATTLNLGSNITGGSLIMTPAFQAKMSGNQNISDNVYTKVEFDTEDYDTNSMYDTSTYRFTPTTAGKYYVYTYASLSGEANSEIINAKLSIYLNGSEHLFGYMSMSSNYVEIVNITTVGAIDMNGSTDYIEVYASINTVSTTPQIKGTTRSRFGAYKIIGA